MLMFNITVIEIQLPMELLRYKTLHVVSVVYIERLQQVTCFFLLPPPKSNIETQNNHILQRRYLLDKDHQLWYPCQTSRCVAIYISSWWFQTLFIFMAEEMMWFACI